MADTDVPNRIGKIGKFSAIVIDVSDIERSLDFWLNVHGGEKVFSNPAYARIGDPAQPPTLLLQKVPEAKTMKNRLHLDYEITDLEAAVEQVIQLGGTELNRISEYGLTWAVMGDPDGNEFCLITKPEKTT